MDPKMEKLAEYHLIYFGLEAIIVGKYSINILLLVIVVLFITFHLLLGVFLLYEDRIHRFVLNPTRESLTFIALSVLTTIVVLLVIMTDNS